LKNAADYKFLQYLSFWLTNHVFAYETLAEGGHSGPGLVTSLLLKICEMLGQTWFVRMWLRMDQDTRMVIGMVFFSTSIWGLMRFVLHCGMQNGQGCHQD